MTEEHEMLKNAPLEPSVDDRSPDRAIARYGRRGGRQQGDRVSRVPAGRTGDAPEPPAKTTSGLAIASFVLSLVWIVGLGSLLAVIFSVQARRRMRRSQDMQSGEGLAVAGLVVGILGLLGAVVFWALVVAVGRGAHHVQTELTPKTVTMKAGQVATLSTAGGDNSGLTTATVLALTHPASPTNRSLAPDTGKELAVADIQLCAGRHGSRNGPSTFSFRVVLTAGAEVAPSFLDATTPSFGDPRGLGSNQCARGYLTFQLPAGGTPTAVRYQPGPFRTYEWTLP